MARLTLAQVGCGGMGLRHAYGLIELKAQGFDTFDVVAVCDAQAQPAEHVAGELAEGLGRRPNVYTSFGEMLSKETSIDAVNIVTDTRAHHTLALQAFDAGKHVAVEKPFGLTVRACQRMMNAAARAKKVLSVSENYRRDPMNRLVRAILDARAIGTQRLLVHTSLWGHRQVHQVAAWRHLKLRGGFMLEYGVHDADLLHYFMGDVESVYAETRLWERERYPSHEPVSGNLAKFYGHRVQEEIDKGSAVQCTAEDMAIAVVRFKSGAVGQLSMSASTPGARTNADILYCSEGSIGLPGSRSGRPAQVTRLGAEQPLSEQETLALAPAFQVDDTTARMFGGKRRISSYKLPFEEVDRKLVAIELQDFADAILAGKGPEVTGEVGLKAVALAYAILESGYARKAVSFADVMEDRVNAYQQEINASVGL